MNRREYISATVSLGAVAATAGCLETLTGKNPQKASEHMQNAIDLMQETTEYFDSVSSGVESTEGTEYSFEKQYVDTRVQEARRELDRAEGLATDSQIQTIITLRDWLDIHETQSGLVDAMVKGVGSINRALAFNGSGDYERALDELEIAESDFEVASQSIQSVRAEFEDIESQDLTGVSQIEYSDLESNIEFTENQIPELQQKVTLYREFVKGNRDLSAGSDHLESGDYGLAEQSLQDAASSYEEATTLSNEILEGQGDSGEPGLIRVSCRTTNYAEASSLLSEAAVKFSQQAISDGNELQNEAQEKLNATC